MISKEGVISWLTTVPIDSSFEHLFVEMLSDGRINKSSSLSRLFFNKINNHVQTLVAVKYDENSDFNILATLLMFYEDEVYYRNVRLAKGGFTNAYLNYAAFVLFPYFLLRETRHNTRDWEQSFYNFDNLIRSEFKMHNNASGDTLKTLTYLGVLGFLSPNAEFDFSGHHELISKESFDFAYDSDIVKKFDNIMDVSTLEVEKSLMLLTVITVYEKKFDLIEVKVFIDTDFQTYMMVLYEKPETEEEYMIHLYLTEIDTLVYQADIKSFQPGKEIINHHFHSIEYAIKSMINDSKEEGESNILKLVNLYARNAMDDEVVISNKDVKKISDILVGDYLPF